MMIQKMKDALTDRLASIFPNIPLVFREDAGIVPEAPFFRSELALAEFDPISANRYAVRFRFHISYVPTSGKPLPLIMDEMLEGLTVIRVEERPCRAATVAWERPKEGTATGDGYFRAEYAIQMTSDQEEPDVKMQTLKQGGGLK